MPSGKQKILFYRIFLAQYCQDFFKKYHLSGNLKFNNLGIPQTLKLRDSIRKIL